MSDQSAEPTPEEVGTSQSEAGSPPPWGDDFNAERAWQTITHLRGREKELESAAKAYERLQEDEDARLEQLQKWGFEIEDGADDDEEDLPDYGEEEEQPAHDPRVDVLQEQLNSVLQANAIREFNEDLDSAAKEAGVTLSQRDRVIVQRESMENGFNPQATRNALNALKEEREELRKQAIEEYRSSKKAPHVSSVGRGATQVPDLDDQEQRIAWMTERAQANIEQ